MTEPRLFVPGIGYRQLHVSDPTPEPPPEARQPMFLILEGAPRRPSGRKYGITHLTINRCVHLAALKGPTDRQFEELMDLLWDKGAIHEILALAKVGLYAERTE